MNRLLVIALVVCNGLTAAQSPTDCPLPSEYVLGFLKKSSTLYRGSQDWQDTIKKDGATADTVYAQTHLTGYSGIFARYIQLGWLAEDAVKGSFTTSSKGNTVEVASVIEDLKVTKTANEKEAHELEALATSSPKHTERQTDFCSSCAVVKTSQFDKKTNQLRVLTKSTCKTRMPRCLFMEQIQKKTN